MQFYILGTSIFFFASALALCVYSCSLLNRSIHILSYSIDLIERINRDAHVDVFRKEGTE
ncbi:MAG: hypothetical protein IJG55_05350 [Synergistaceae bacterium]|nr:hypothetical protein [Synergistaceae bacterium]